MPTVERDRLEAVLSTSADVVAYARWLASRERNQAGTGRDYLFSQERLRFEPRAEDVVVVAPGLEVSSGQGRSKRGKSGKQRGQGSTLLRRGELNIEVALPRTDVERILAAIDGERCLAEVRWHANVGDDVMARFLRAAFGQVVFAPAAVMALEAQLSGCEIVRFAAPPYAIERAYWENMIDVRERASEGLGDDFLTGLRALHVIAVMGSTLERFYQPASPAADTEVAPGQLFDSPVVILRRSPAVFVSGPRVNAKLLGGEVYHAALYRSLGDEAALGPRRHVVDGLDWGEVVIARANRDVEAAPWFLPPRPLTAYHFAALASAWQDSDTTEAAAQLAALARFHQRFVRLHPFRAANQSLAMNLVNARLAAGGGGGIPHLLLDHMALRLSEAAYAELFARAVAAFQVTGTAAERLGTLMERTRRSFAVVEKLAGGVAASDLGDPEGERFALLRPTAAG